MKNSIVYLSLIGCLWLAACTQNPALPVSLESSATPTPDQSVPAVDERLAKEVGVERLIYHIGPVDLQKTQQADAMMESPLTMRFQTDKDLWVIGFIPRVVDSKGNELPAELLHHAIISNLHEDNALCSGQPNPFIVASPTLQKIDFPHGYGYPVLASDPLEARVVLTNPTSNNFMDISFELTLITRKMSEFSNMKDVRPFFAELEPCNHSPMSAPPRTFSEKSATYQLPIAGELVVAQALIKDFGASVELTAGTENKPFWRAEAIKDGDHKVNALTDNPLIDEKGPSFKAGDAITVKVSYDNSSDNWLNNAVGGAMIYVVPE